MNPRDYFTLRRPKPLWYTRILILVAFACCGIALFWYGWLAFALCFTCTLCTAEAAIFVSWRN